MCGATTTRQTCAQSFPPFVIIGLNITSVLAAVLRHFGTNKVSQILFVFRRTSALAALCFLRDVFRHTKIQSKKNKLNKAKKGEGSQNKGNNKEQRNSRQIQGT